MNREMQLLLIYEALHQVFLEYEGVADTYDRRLASLIEFSTRPTLVAQAVMGYQRHLGY